VLRAAAHLPLSAIAIEEPRHAFIIAAGCIIQQLILCVFTLLFSSLMIKNRWTHPAQLTNGGVFANTSPAKRAWRAAYGLVGVCFQLYSGSRGAELFRW
jgi:hypothetical protein